ncbi:protein mono-ADP-ribosyltransferase PARP12 [Mastacembelus armatus]|uniref:protein mono-ADP-ribosyltransferase PARP12 n=1 Tax=Mastacembelus armatus TaxID=205130 RepID=UPI000E460930|nr:protein mono-ADP-ribosyltransferase PARP12-like [Mastacembelus armatus]
MATADRSDDETASESDFNDESDTDGESQSDEETDCQTQVKPCKFYNSGSCRDGDRCPNLHVCKYFLKGNCRYGSRCKLKHSRSEQVPDPSASTNPKLTDGRYYQWQLHNGRCWQDVENDHIIEAQYCLPHTKSIKIYNTPYGAVSIDFNRMRVYGKRLRVRRLDDRNTVWTWYCILRHKWIKYGDKDSKGHASPVQSSEIEKKFQSNPSSSFTFNVGADTFEIKFREMRQVSKQRMRKVTRRPLYRQKAGVRVSQVTSGIQNMSLGTKPQWEFKGQSGRWHVFKHRQGTSTECSITSDDIERQYQQNPSGSLNFTVNRNPYKLDLGAMSQTNLTTQHKRQVRRV